MILGRWDHVPASACDILVLALYMVEYLCTNLEWTHMHTNSRLQIVVHEEKVSLAPPRLVLECCVSVLHAGLTFSAQDAGPRGLLC